VEVFWIAGAVALIAWTQAKEEIAKEFRNWLQHQSETGKTLVARKLAYMLTCEFCFSFWVSLISLIVFRHRVAYDDWRGVILALFATWGIANIYMTGYSRFRVEIRKDQMEIKKEEAKMENGAADKTDGDGKVAPSDARCMR
jgi:hypothetical protein